jgi:rod shape-determining protein MreC
MHADLQDGDELVTSGLDGVYPPGIPVARVLRTEPPRHTPFARALCLPVAGVGQHRQLMVLQRQLAPAAATTTRSGAAATPPAAAGTRPADRP